MDGAQLIFWTFLGLLAMAGIRVIGLAGREQCPEREPDAPLEPEDIAWLRLWSKSDKWSQS